MVALASGKNGSMTSMAVCDLCLSQYLSKDKIGRAHIERYVARKKWDWHEYSGKSLISNGCSRSLGATVTVSFLGFSLEVIAIPPLLVTIPRQDLGDVIR